MDTINYAQFVFAFLLVIGLIGLLAYLLRRFGDPNKMLAAKGRSARIKTLETHFLDSKRRLVIVARDKQEYVLLLADGRELLIESYPAKEPSE